MMLQEINLYQDRFREKKILLSAVQMLILCAVFLVLLGISSYWYSDQLSQLEQAGKVLTEDKERLSQQLALQSKKLESLLANSKLDNDITKISTDIAVRKRIINFIENNQFGSGVGFSARLRSLGEVNVSDVWLTEILLSEKSVKLSGSALKAESIPEYFNLFRQHDLFSGQLFETFEIDRKKEQDWKVDFLIASMAGDNE